METATARFNTVTLLGISLVCCHGLLASAHAAPQADDLGRDVPEACRQTVVPSLESDAPGATADARWNAHYLAALDAFFAEDWEFAERHFCAALVPAKDFGPRDWRFAETLDELGLVSFMNGNLERAEIMQGAAVAEMLLALGPDAAEVESSNTARQGRLSSVPIYLGRLNFLYTRMGKPELAVETEAATHRILTRGYVALDADLARRLDWLISRYLLAEDFATARWLSELQAEILSDE